jgi:hypothetical protein
VPHLAFEILAAVEAALINPGAPLSVFVTLSPPMIATFKLASRSANRPVG